MVHDNKKNLVKKKILSKKTNEFVIFEQYTGRMLSVKIKNTLKGTNKQIHNISAK